VENLKTAQPKRTSLRMFLYFANTAAALFVSTCELPVAAHAAYRPSKSRRFQPVSAPSALFQRRVVAIWPARSMWWLARMRPSCRPRRSS